MIEGHVGPKFVPDGSGTTPPELDVLKAQRELDPTKTPDVLGEQVLDQPSGVHDLAEVVVKPPTEILPEPAVADLPLNTSVETQEPLFEIPNEALLYIDSINTSKRPLNWVKGMIEHSRNLAEVLSVVSDAQKGGTITIEEENQIKLLISGTGKSVVPAETVPSDNTEETPAVLETNTPESGTETKEVLDGELSELAMTAYLESRDDESLEYLMQIKDPDLQINAVRDIVIKASDAGHFDVAIKIADVIQDKTVKDVLIAWVEEYRQGTQLDADTETPIDLEPPEENEDEINSLLESFDDVKPESGMVPLPEASKLKDEVEQINEELESARKKYASELIAWKNDVRAGKKWWARTKSDLGFEKPMPEKPKSDTLLEAEQEYILAKKKKRQKILENVMHVPVSGPDSDGVVNMESTLDRTALIDQAEKEFQDLEKAISESRPELEKSIMRKTMDKWVNAHPAVKVAVSTLLLTGFGLAVGFVATTAAGAYAGQRLVRAAGGTAMAQGVGKIATKIFNKGNEKRKTDAFDKYVSGMDMSNFEQKERDLMRAFEEADTLEKRQRLYKALAMGAASAGTVLGSGAVLSSFNGPDITGPAAQLPETPKGSFDPLPGTEVKEQLGSMAEVDRKEFLSANKIAPDFKLPPEMSGGLDVNITPPVEAGAVNPGLSGENLMGGNEGVETADSVGTPPPPEVVDVAKDMKVELSSKGFIQDLHNIKAEILQKYGTMDNVPENLRKNFMLKPSTDLAKQFGFYDPENGLSGKGFKGESLLIDDKGNLVYEHGGKSQVIYNTGTNQMGDKFGGEMFKPNIPSPETTPTLEEQTLKAARDNFITEDTKFPIGEEVAPTLEQQTAANFREGLDFTKVPPELETVVVPEPPEIIGANTPIPEAPVSPEGIPMYRGNPIANYQEFGGQKILVLDDRFQEGKQFEGVRKMFAQQFSQNLKPEMNIPASAPFEGGRIDILRDPSTGASQVLLNGKEIAKGYIVPGQNSIKPIDGLGIRTGLFGLFFDSNAYDRAFKSAKGMIKTLSQNPSIIPKK